MYFLKSLYWTTVDVRSVHEDECTDSIDTGIAAESEVATSDTFPVSVHNGVITTTSSGTQTDLSGYHDVASTPGNVSPPVLSETSSLQDLDRPHTSSSGIVEMESPPVSSVSDDGRSPSGLVAFSQSDVSAFTSVVTVKPTSLPVVVQGCEERLRNATDSKNSRRCTSSCDLCTASIICENRSSYSEPDEFYPAQECSLQLSQYSPDLVPPCCQTVKPAQSYTESPVSEYDVASSFDQNSPSYSVVDENLCKDEFAVYDTSYVYTPNVGPMTQYQQYPSSVPVSDIPQYYHSPMPPSMPYAYPPSYPPSYMSPVPSFYSPAMSVIHRFPYPAYPMVSPPRMMPPVGMVPMPYHQSFPVPAPYWMPPSVVCRPVPPMTYALPSQPYPQ